MEDFSSEIRMELDCLFITSTGQLVEVKREVVFMQEETNVIPLDARAL